MIVTCPYCNGTGLYPDAETTCFACSGSGSIDTAGPEIGQLGVDIRNRLVFTVMSNLSDKVDDVQDKCNDIKEKCDEIKAVVDAL